MKKFSFALLSVVCALAVSVAQAGTIEVGGAGTVDAGATGTLQIVFNGNTHSFGNGGIGLALTAATPGVIEFTDATIVNEGRWATLGQINVTANTTGTLNAFSLSTPGLPLGDNVIYANVGYKVVGAAGSSTVIEVAASGEDPLFDGTIPPFGADVSADYSFVNGTVSVAGGGPIIPEPATLAMVATGMIGLVLRRRNG